MVAVAPKARRISVKKANIRGLLAFGANNLFPQDLINMCSDSVTATACLQARAQFIQGNGFYDEAIAKMVVHRSGLTMDTVLSRQAHTLSWGEVIVLLVGYNGLGQINSIKPVPYEFIRLCEPNELGEITHAAICPYLVDGYNIRKRNDYIKVPLFNPDPAVVQKEMADAGGIDKYYGQLIFDQFWLPGDGYYHQPSYMPAIKAIESEAQLGTYNWNTIINGFNISGILSVISDKQASSTYDPMLDPTSIEYQLSANQGAENSGRVMVMRFKELSEAQATNFQQISGVELTKRYEYTADWAKGEITTAMRTPNEIVNIRRQNGIAPTGDEIIVSSQLMYQTVNPFQRRLKEIFELILQYWYQPVTLGKDGCSIENLDYFKNLSTTKKDGPANTMAQAG